MSTYVYKYMPGQKTINLKRTELMRPAKTPGAVPCYRTISISKRLLPCVCLPRNSKRQLPGVGRWPHPLPPPSGREASGGLCTWCHRYLQGDATWAAGRRLKSRCLPVILILIRPTSTDFPAGILSLFTHSLFFRPPWQSSLFLLITITAVLSQSQARERTPRDGFWIDREGRNKGPHGSVSGATSEFPRLWLGS